MLLAVISPRSLGTPTPWKRTYGPWALSATCSSPGLRPQRIRMTEIRWKDMEQVTNKCKKNSQNIQKYCKHRFLDHPDRGGPNDCFVSFFGAASPKVNVDPWGKKRRVGFGAFLEGYPQIIHFHEILHYKPSLNWEYPHLWNPPFMDFLWFSGTGPKESALPWARQRSAGKD